MTAVAVLDYGSGNIHSVMSSLAAAGAEARLTNQAAEAIDADGLVVPGVGAFAACMAQLRAIGGEEIIRARVVAGRAVLGICVGHQILFSTGSEHGIDSTGVGLYPGQVRQLPVRQLPHMGWNRVDAGPGSAYFTTPEWFYFVHSYAGLSQADLPDGAHAAWAEHDGIRFLAGVESGPVLSTQFHPEKSGSAGLNLLRRWVCSVGMR